MDLKRMMRNKQSRRDVPVAPKKAEQPSRLFISKRDACSTLGFTLIELLVALTIFGILAAAMTGVVRNAMDSVEQSQKSIADTSRLRALETLLGDALREAVSVTLSTNEQRWLTEQNDFNAEEGTLRFRGDAQSIGFCLPRPFLAPERDGYMHWITLEILPDEESKLFSLQLRDVAFLNGIDNPAGDDWHGITGEVDARLPVTETILIREMPAMSFRYWIYDLEESDEPVEMEPEETAGDYALTEPEFIELEIAGEIWRFDYCVKERML